MSPKTKLEEMFAKVGDKVRLEKSILELARFKSYLAEERDKNILRSELSLLVELMDKYGTDREYLVARINTLKPTNHKY